MSAPLRAALAGCGGISTPTMQAAGASDDFAIVALQDVDATALARLGDRFDVARRHTEFAELLTDDIDFVLVNTPNHLHAEQALAAIAAGKPCLVQKPMARSRAEAELMAAAARGAGVPLGVTMFEIGRPVNHQLRAMLRDGWFGEPVLVQACAAHDYYLDTPPPPGNWRLNPDLVGGAAFIQLAVHHLNLACWILDREPLAAQATTTRGHTVFSDETTLATITFAGGVVGAFAASYATKLDAFTLAGTHGSVQVLGDRVIVSGDAPYAGDLFRYDTPGASAMLDATPTAEQLRAVDIHSAFARSLRGGDPYPCPAELGTRDMRVLEAVTLSAENGARIDVCGGDTG